jgi:poly-D-alanine transfer protein DltD
MELDKAQVIDFLEKEGKNEHVQKALKELPDRIDHEKHAQLLEKVGVDPGKLVEHQLQSRFGV